MLSAERKGKVRTMNKLLVLMDTASSEEFYIEVPCSNQDIVDEIGNDFSTIYELTDGDTGKFLSKSVGLSEVFRINDLATQIEHLSDEQIAVVEALAEKYGGDSLNAYQHALYDFRNYELIDGTDELDVGLYILETVLGIELHKSPLAHAVNPFLLGKEAFTVGIATKTGNKKTLLDTSKIY